VPFGFCEPPTLRCGGAIFGPRTYTGVSVPLGNLASGLSRLLGGTVIDKTGLTGNFDISMEWIPDESQTIQLPPEAARSSSSDAAGGSIFTALKDQLGLKLESQKSPVEVLVIDRAERASEN
jgi:uncharacterized protein (TIGR03435 family)